MGSLTDALAALIRPKKRQELGQYFEMLEGYTPCFSTYDGGVYEMELTRACVHTFATHVSKLQPNVEGADRRGLAQLLNGKVNPFQLSAQFLYKCATLYETKNTLVILPLLDDFDRVCGYYPANYESLEVLDVKGEPWLRLRFPTGKTVAYELALCGVVSKFLYTSDLIGEDNRVLNPTMQLLQMQNQGIQEGIKNSASFRFMAQVSNFIKPEDLKKERAQFVKENLGPDSGGLALFPNTYRDVKQVVSSARVVDPEQVKLIQDRVWTYFGCNDKILHNDGVTGDTWAAYYEGKIEPFALQLSQAMTGMTFNANELSRGNAIVWSSNRLQYLSNADKLQVSSQMFDRGILTTNNVMDIWNLPHVPDGDRRYIRKEYTEVSKLDTEQQAVMLPAEKETENVDTGKETEVEE